MTLEVQSAVNSIKMIADLPKKALIEIATLSNDVASQRVYSVEALRAEIERIALEAWTTASMIFEEVYQQVTRRHKLTVINLSTPAWKHLVKLHEDPSRF